MITILDIHLILLGIGIFLLIFKTLYFRDVYDSWAPRDGERLEKLPTRRLVQVFVLVE